MALAHDRRAYRPSKVILVDIQEERDVAVPQTLLEPRRVALVNDNFEVFPVAKCLRPSTLSRRSSNQVRFELANGCLDAKHSVYCGLGPFTAKGVVVVNLHKNVGSRRWMHPVSCLQPQALTLSVMMIDK